MQSIPYLALVAPKNSLVMGVKARLRPGSFLCGYNHKELSIHDHSFSDCCSGYTSRGTTSCTHNWWMSQKNPVPSIVQHHWEHVLCWVRKRRKRCLFGKKEPLRDAFFSLDLDLYASHSSIVSLALFTEACAKSLWTFHFIRATSFLISQLFPFLSLALLIALCKTLALLWEYSSSVRHRNRIIDQ